MNDQTNSSSLITWNPQVKLIVSDVDETIADNYLPATPEMADELTSVLEEGRILFLVTGASLKRIRMRITDAIPPKLRRNILAAHCSGAEVWGFSDSGEVREKPFYSFYEGALSVEQKASWREIIKQLISEFNFTIHEPMGADEFKKLTNENPLAIIIEDRGPQITFEFINSFALSKEKAEALPFEIPEKEGKYDLRDTVFARAEELLSQENIPVTPRYAGQWAIDFALKGVNKTTAVKTILENETILSEFNLTREDVTDPNKVEIWGDKFSAVRGGTDRHMCEALQPTVRAIDFREEDPSEFPEGFNIVLWNGKKHPQDGLLEYLQLRHIKPSLETESI